MMFFPNLKHYFISLFEALAVVSRAFGRPDRKALSEGQNLRGQPLRHIGLPQEASSPPSAPEYGIGRISYSPKVTTA
jgi:hypothetical protein